MRRRRRAAGYRRTKFFGKRLAHSLWRRRKMRVSADYRLYRRIGGETKYLIVKSEAAGAVYALLDTTGYSASTFGRLSLAGGTGAGLFNPPVAAGEMPPGAIAPTLLGRRIKVLGIRFQLDVGWTNPDGAGGASGELHPKFRLMFNTPVDSSKFASSASPATWPYEWVSRGRYPGLNETFNTVPYTEADPRTPCKGLRVYKDMVIKAPAPSFTALGMTYPEYRKTFWIPIYRTMEIKRQQIEAADGTVSTSYALAYNQDIWYWFIGQVGPPAVGYESVPTVAWRATWLYMDM